jgi:hypothetical protein
LGILLALCTLVDTKANEDLIFINYVLIWTFIFLQIAYTITKNRQITYASQGPIMNAAPGLNEFPKFPPKWLHFNFYAEQKFSQSNLVIFKIHKPSGHG